ncbi:tryptophan halogenase family protein [Thalassotalea litorea]|uniref:tryptophan halogenase family protein n=1 Tax=Thalassotalea litorea TaxID=2020715 RepID=UPI003736D1DE
MYKNIKHVVVVGGGTAGWLVAANLAKQFNSKSPGALKVTLVESPTVPSVGVGEGTWPTMRKTLANLGIKETDFIRYCNASLKQGTKFVDWHNKSAADHYYHLFTSIFDPSEFNLAPYWQLGKLGRDFTYAEAVSVQGEICDLNLSPKTITNREYEGMQNYAYHLDAALFAKMLTEHSTQVLGVNHIRADVEHCKLTKNGCIEAIQTKQGHIVEGEFFVDCTGFRAKLIGETLKVPFKPINDVLLTDHAVTIQIPYQPEDDEVSSCTLSTAQEAGWIWDIGLASRRGTGYVYSSNHTSHERAEQVLRDYLGPQAEGLDARRIPMQLGYREKFWHKNCLAVGLSASFVEPLEASAIFLIEASANMLTKLLPANTAGLALSEKMFNESFSFRYHKTVDFIKMHYLLSNRKESFWTDNKQPDTIPKSLQMKLEQWQSRPLNDYDFDNVYEPFPLESYQYVLYGMGFKQDLIQREMQYSEVARAQHSCAQVQQIKSKLRDQLPTNRELLEKLRDYEFQAI